jgi:CheY-like chemotaxis protein
MLRVLIADRNSFYRRVVRQNMMPGRPCEMAEVEAPLDAISLLLTQPFDLLIADWDMLILNEGGLLELVARRAKLARRRMPVMAMMANPTQSSVLHASNNAVEMVLRKPFSPKQLQQRTAWLLQRSEVEVAS